MLLFVMAICCGVGEKEAGKEERGEGRKESRKCLKSQRIARKIHR